jgi:exopolysaccharide biosynthesis polyprenyl glycosylphosphotransferase
LTGAALWFHFGTDARMESIDSMDSMTATSADGNGTVAVSVPVHTQLYAPSASAVERSSELRRMLATADFIAGAVSGLIVALIAASTSTELVLVCIALAFGWPIVAFVCGLYAVEDLRTWTSGVSEAPKLMLSSMILSWPLYGLLASLEAPHAVYAALIGCLVVAGSAALARTVARMHAHREPRLRQGTLVIGSGAVAHQLVLRLMRHEELGLDPIGFLDDDHEGFSNLPVPALGGLDALPAQLRSGRVDRVMIAFSRAGHEELLQCIRLCRDAGVPVDIVPRLFEFLDGARTVDQIGGMPLLSITAPKFSRLSEVAKRTLDVTFSPLALIVLSPLLLAIAIAIKLDSKGPVLFVQRRSGRGGTFFTLYKFRSMHVGSTVEVRDDGAIVKLTKDDRITRVGRLIRRFSLDEVPQLLNVLRGEMSLVGPRPLVEAEAAVLRDWQERRADLRPGLTGPWQVAGRSHIPFQEMVKFDYQYVAGWSLARDVEIILATIPAVLAGRGAY